MGITAARTGRPDGGGCAGVSAGMGVCSFRVVVVVSSVRRDTNAVAGDVGGEDDCVLNSCVERVQSS